MQLYQVTNALPISGKAHSEASRQNHGYIDQPKVSDIIHGKLSKYTLDRLIRFLRLFGRDIEIRVKRRAKRSEPTSLLVVGVSNPRNNSRRRAAI